MSGAGGFDILHHSCNIKVTLTGNLKLGTQNNSRPKVKYLMFSLYNTQPSFFSSPFFIEEITQFWGDIHLKGENLFKMFVQLYLEDFCLG